MSQPAFSSATDPSHPTSAGSSRWGGVLTLTAATFLVVTSEMLPVGVLTPMSGDLDVSPAAVGSTLTITGVVSALTAPLVPRLIRDMNRRTVLAFALLLLAVGNCLTAMADEYPVLVLGRIVVGVSMGTVWGMAAAIATRIAAPSDVPRAVSVVVSGVATASVIGVPVGTLVGDVLGWRAAFGGLAGLAVVNAFMMVFALPVLRRPSPSGTASARGGRGWVNATVVAGLIVVALLVTAHFAVYTYVRPILEERTTMDPATLAAFLLLYGLCGLVGNFVAGATAGRRPRRTVLVLACGIAAALALLALFGTGMLAAAVAIFVWGLAYGGLSVSGQLWMSHAAPAHVETITGLYVGIFTAAIALGALLGGLIVDRTGVLALLWISTSLTLVALTVGLLVSVRSRVNTAT